jgi:ribonuclease VapC
VTVVLDASAILAFLQDEEGAYLVEVQLATDARCGAANWAEVAQKIRGAGRDWSLARALLASYGVSVETVTESDAEWAAATRRASPSDPLNYRLTAHLSETHQTINLEEVALRRD